MQWLLPLVSQIVREKKFHMNNDAIMAVLSAPAVDKTCESFTHNPLPQALGQAYFPLPHDNPQEVHC